MMTSTPEATELADALGGNVYEVEGNPDDRVVLFWFDVRCWPKPGAELAAGTSQPTAAILAVCGRSWLRRLDRDVQDRAAGPRRTCRRRSASRRRARARRRGGWAPRLHGD